MKHPPTKSDNYIPKMLEWVGRNPPPPGTLADVTVTHEDWCDGFRGVGFCNCDPSFRYGKPGDLVQ